MTNKRKWKRIRNFQKRNVRICNLIERQKQYQKYLEKLAGLFTFSQRGSSRNITLPVGSDKYEEYRYLFGPDHVFRVFNDKGLPEFRDYIPGEVLPDGWSILPFFPAL